MMKKIVLIIAVICCVHVSNAQSPVEDDPSQTGVPIDGGIVTITLIAAAFGAKRHKENKDNNSL